MRSLAVRIDGEISESFEVNEGVRGGCCLTPLLFIIFMDKIIRQANIEGNVEVGWRSDYENLSLRR